MSVCKECLFYKMLQDWGPLKYRCTLREREQIARADRGMWIAVTPMQSACSAFQPAGNVPWHVGWTNTAGALTEVEVVGQDAEVQELMRRLVARSGECAWASREEGERDGEKDGD